VAGGSADCTPISSLIPVKLGLWRGPMDTEHSSKKQRSDNQMSGETKESASTVLRTVVFLGSAKNVSPPWGGDKRLGDRVYKYVTNTLNTRESKIGSVSVKHDVTVFDPLVVFGKGGELSSSGAEVQTPQFFLSNDQTPAGMAQMLATIKQADAYVVISPEYNHSPPPALTSMLDHFGGGNYGGKPSAIVTYSMGPFGGARAAMMLQPLLHELGCLPVSKMTHLPEPASIFDDKGVPLDDKHRMLNQLPGMLTQLEFMALAMRAQRALAPEVFGN